MSCASSAAANLETSCLQGFLLRPHPPHSGCHGSAQLVRKYVDQNAKRKIRTQKENTLIRTQHVLELQVTLLTDTRTHIHNTTQHTNNNNTNATHCHGGVRRTAICTLTVYRAYGGVTIAPKPAVPSYTRQLFGLREGGWLQHNVCEPYMHSCVL